MSNVLDDPELRGIMDYFWGLVGDATTFPKLLGFIVESPDFDHARLRFPMQEVFIGNIAFRTLHGAIICAMLDEAGGHVVFLNVFNQTRSETREKQINRISKIGSVNLRIDYLVPGIGKEFIAMAHILRIGKRVAVTRMELRNEENRLIAVGTGTYTVG
ncbi:MAG: thioesterase family protein [Chloroflexi bacterium]|nr:thioesterase family protein [Chloroflexota bacterium]